MKEWQELPLNTEHAEFTPDFANRQHLARLGNTVVRAYGNYGLRENRLPHVQTEAVLARELFDELEQTYRIPHAGFMPFVFKSGDFKSSGRPRMGIVSSFIEGEVLEDKGDISNPAHKQAATELLYKLTDYVTAKFEKDEPMLTDIFKLSQYVFDEKRREFVLIDTEPYIEEDEYYKHFVTVKYLRPFAERVLDKQSLQAWGDRMQPLEELATMFDEEF